jgi:hypothetical protein
MFECLNILVIYVVFFYVDECSPFMFRYYRLQVLHLVLFKIWRFPWLDLEGIIIKNVTDDVLSLIIFFVV